MEKTTITIRKKTAEKIKEIAKQENRSVSAQIDYMINQQIRQKEIK